MWVTARSSREAPHGAVCMIRIKGAVRFVHVGAAAAAIAACSAMSTVGHARHFHWHLSLNKMQSSDRISSKVVAIGKWPSLGAGWHAGCEFRGLKTVGECRVGRRADIRGATRTFNRFNTCTKEKEKTF